MRRVGVDAHVLTGKFQGSRTYMLDILGQIGRLDPVNQYLIYSFDPAATRAMLPFDNFEHVLLAVRSPVPRLLAYWPWEQRRRRLDLLLLQYFTPLLQPDRHLVIIHDILFESHPQYFRRLARLRFRTLVRLAATRSRAVFATSRTTRSELVARYRVPAVRLHLSSNGIDPARHEVDHGRAPPQEIMPYVLAVGRLEPRKNIGALLRAFRLMRTPGVQLLVIGREDFSAAKTVAELRALQRETGRVTWLTDVVDADLPYYYRYAAVFAFPTFAEGFGIPMLEAIVQGTPVVTSDHAAMQEVGGSLARYFDPNAADADRVLASLLDQAVAEGRRWTRAEIDAHLAQFDMRRSAQAIVDVVNDPDSCATPLPS